MKRNTEIYQFVEKKSKRNKQKRMKARKEEERREKSHFKSTIIRRKRPKQRHIPQVEMKDIYAASVHHTKTVQKKMIKHTENRKCKCEEDYNSLVYQWAPAGPDPVLVIK